MTLPDTQQGRSPEQQADNEMVSEIITSATVILCVIGALLMWCGVVEVGR